MSSVLVNEPTNDNAPPNPPPSSGYAPLPADDYDLEIVESWVGPTALKTGTILKTKAQVASGPFAGRLMYLNYSLESDNPTAQEIGQRDFAALRRALGVLSVSDSERLHFKPFRVQIGLQTSKATGEIGNVIKRYHFDARAA